MVHDEPVTFAVGPAGCRIWFGDAGVGEPLLLIAGAPGNHGQWSWRQPYFERQHTVLVYDQRGVGKSDAPLEPYSIEVFAEDAIAVLDAAQVRRAHIYGYGVSNGGRIAQCLAISHPERVGAAVFGCTSPGKSHGVPRTAEADTALRSGMTDTDPDRRTRILSNLLYTPAFQEAHPEIMAELRTRVTELPPPEILRLHYIAADGYDSWDELPSIRVPVLVIHGTDDPQVPVANEHLLAERIPGAELHLVQGARHGFQLEAHPAVTETVLDFLARHPLKAVEAGLPADRGSGAERSATRPAN